MKNKKVLAFDLGRVLFDFDYSIALNKIKDEISVPRGKTIDELFENDFGLSFEKGLVTAQEFYRHFKDMFKATLSYDHFINVWCGIFSPKNKVIDLVKRLEANYSLYLISNINELHFDYLYSKYPQVFSLFKELILSYKVKSVKPEKLIYQTLKNKARVAFEDIIYIDDRNELIVKARDFNLQCIQFISFEQLLGDLGKLGVFVA